MSSPGFNVLFVCTGNVCRSPMAERIFAAQAPSDVFAVSSVGIQAMTGKPIAETCATALRELGYDADGHVARRATSQLIMQADLILTAESSHRSAIVQGEPLTFRRAFTLREFARLSRGLPPLDDLSEERLKMRVREVAGRRGWVDVPAEGADEIDDPYGKSLNAAHQCGKTTESAIGEIAMSFGLSRLSVS